MLLVQNHVSPLHSASCLPILQQMASVACLVTRQQISVIVYMQNIQDIGASKLTLPKTRSPIVYKYTIVALQACIVTAYIHSHPLQVTCIIMTRSVPHDLVA